MLSCEEINRAIAKQRRVLTTSASWGCPDYCHDWAAAGLLLESVWVKRPWYELIGMMQEWRNKGCALTEAIARAYHAALCGGE